MLIKSSEAEQLSLKNNSVSIEMKMIIDDGSNISPCVKLFCIDDVRGKTKEEVIEAVTKSTAKIARNYALSIIKLCDIGVD